jgi:subtilisin family serine protease
MDDNGHGSNVAGIIGSSSSQYPGVAPDVNLIALKVLDANANGSWTTIDQGLQWVISHQAQYNIVAVNLSVGSGNYTTPPPTVLDNDLATIKNDGLFISVASGNGFYTNQSQPGLAYPAVNPNVVSVGAVWDGNFGQQTWSSGAIDYTTAPDQILSITQRSSALDLLAPGAWINSTWNDGGFQTMGGTSMAAAVVSGAAVLMHQALDAKGEHNLTGESALLQMMQQTGTTIVDNATAANVTPTGLSFKRLNLLAAMNAIGMPAQPPTLSPIASQTLTVGSPLTVTLTATDPSHDPITFSASVVVTPSAAYTLKQQLGLTYPGSYYTNQDGANEKWLTGSGGSWYCILPTGQLYRWAGTMAATLQPANLIATLDSSYYQDPSKLWNAAPPQTPPISLKVVGNQLTIQETAAWTGTFTVQVTASDNGLTSTETFSVTTVNAPPSLAAIANQTVSHGHAVALILQGNDPAGKPLQYTAHIVSAPAGTTPATLSVQGNTLTIATAATFVGSFTVQVTASDGVLSASQSFTVTVTNAAPVLSAIPTQTMAGSLTVTLSASDGDGDALSYSAVVLPPTSTLYQLQQQLQLAPYNGSYYTNLWGAGEKWLAAPNGQWYCLMPTGQLYRWAGTMTATLQPANLVASLGTAVYADPTLLWQAKAPQPPPVAVKVQGNVLTFQATGALSGSFSVQVTVSDGLASAVQTFTVNVVNTPPSLAAIASQSMAAGQTSLSVPLAGSDPDGDALRYSAVVQTPSASLYQLEQQLQLRQYNNSYYTNLWGAGEKWLTAPTGQWYCLMPTGQLYRWAGTLAATLQPANLVASLGTAVYAEPRLLWQAQPPQTPAISLTVQGGQLVVQRPASLLGVFTVQVTVSDGQSTATQTFTLTLN